MLDVVRLALLLDKIKDTQTFKHAARVRWDLDPRSDLADLQCQRCSRACMLVWWKGCWDRGTYCLDFMSLFQDGDL